MSWATVTPGEGTPKHDNASDERARIVTGASFLLDGNERDSPIWGDSERILWAEGESCMIYSPPGVGKTTLAGLLTRARLGLATDVLGLPMTSGRGRVLYLAMDRPRQTARALRRQFSDAERQVLHERLRVWQGPLADNLATVPTLLADLATTCGADTIVVDSMKDTGLRLAEDAGGVAYNVARQHALAAGVEFLELHHARKAPSEGRKRLTIDDVYGSMHITAGSGTVIALSGDPADTRVELYTLRAPQGDVFLEAAVDRDAGTMTTTQPMTVTDALQGQGSLLARDVALLMYGRQEKADENRARRALEKAATAGTVEKVPLRAESGGRDRTAYRLADGPEGSRT